MMKTRITWSWTFLFSLCSFLTIAQKNGNPDKGSEYTIEIEYAPVEDQKLREKSAMNLTSFHCQLTTPDHLDDIPASTSEEAFKLLDDLAVTSDWPIESL